jgi:hypothetical protein
MPPKRKGVGLPPKPIKPKSRPEPIDVKQPVGVPRNVPTPRNPKGK